MSSGKNKSFALAVLATALILAVFRTVLIITFMEKTSVDSNAYYMPDNLAATLFGVLAAVCFAAIIAGSYTIGGSKLCLYTVDSGSTSIAALICAFTLFCQFVLYIVMLIRGTTETGVLDTLTAVVALLAALLYFLRLGRRFGLEEHEPARFAAPALLPVALCALRLLNDFIKSSASPMESSGAYHILSLCAAMLFFLADGQATIKKTGAPKYFIFGGAAVIFLAVYSIPNIIVHGTGLLTFDYSAVASIGDICITAFICTRLVGCRTVPKAKAEPSPAE